jgi:MFS family permease
LNLSDSGDQLGLNVAAQFVPMLLLGAWAGGFADRHDKWRGMLITQSAMAVLALALGVVVLTDVATVWLLHALAFVSGIANAFDNPLRRGLITELADPEDLSNAMSLNTAVMTGSRAIGPALAALLIVPIGAGWLFIANGVSYLAILIGVAGIDATQRRVQRSSGPARGQVMDGVRFVWRHPVLRPTMVALVVVSTFAFNYGVSLPLLSSRTFGESGINPDALFGWFMAVASIGSLAGSLWTARKPAASLGAMLGCAVLQGSSAIAIGLAPNVVIALVLCVPLGFGGAGFIATTSGLLVSTVDASMRGRVLALQATAFLGSTPVGGPITGRIGEAFGARWSLIYGGIITVGSILAVGYLLRRQPSVTRSTTTV